MAEDARFTWGEQLPTLPCGELTLLALAASDVAALYEIFGDPRNILLRPDWRARANTP